MTDLTKLAERVEAATRPDRRLDGLVFVALNPDKRIITGSKPGRFPQDPIYGTPRDLLPMLEEGNGKDGADYLGAPAYTASLDATMALVPEGWRWTMRQAMPDELNPDERGFFARIESSDFKSVTWGRGSDWITDVVSGREAFVWAATPALALCAAALRARANQEHQ